MAKHASIANASQYRSCLASNVAEGINVFRSNRKGRFVWAGRQGLTAICAIVAATGVAWSQERAKDQEPTVLPEIVVEGEAGVVTEGTGSYATSRATVGWKQPVDIKEVPQSVTVITRERLDDALANTMEEAAYTIPNVATATGDLFGGSLYSRGHEVFTYNVDGAPRPFLSLFGTAPDLAFFDRMEVLSGPSGVFQGSGEPVGTINLVRKRALDISHLETSALYGTFNHYRGDVDFTGPMTPNGDLRGRFVGFAKTEDTFVDLASAERAGAYGTLEYDIGDYTTISVGAILEAQYGIRFSGLPTFDNGELVNVSRNTFIGAPWNLFGNSTNEYFADLEHEFEFGGILKFNSRFYERDVDVKNALGISAVDPATGNFDMFTFMRDYQEKNYFADLNLTTPLNIFGRSGEATIGADYRRNVQFTKQNFDFGLGTQNIFNFDPFALVEPVTVFPGVGPGFRFNTKARATELGGYGQGRLEVIDGLRVTLGTRFAHFQNLTIDQGRNLVLTDSVENRIVPFAGLSYDLTEQLSAFTSYSEIFQPQTDQDANGATLEPIVGRQVEMGLKGGFLNDRLRANATVFWIQDENRAEADPNNVGAFVASGEAITTGFEIQVQGAVTGNIDIAAGYNFVETELQTDPTPKHSAVLWGKYSFHDGPLAGLHLGAGVRAVGAFKSVDGAVAIRAPGYAVFDIGGGYQITDGVEATFIVKNVLDKTYIDRVNEVIRGTFFGEPINAQIRLTSRF